MAETWKDEHSSIRRENLTVAMDRAMTSFTTGGTDEVYSSCDKKPSEGVNELSIFIFLRG